MLEGVRKMKRDWKRKNSHPAEGIRLSRAGPVDDGNCGDGEAHGCADCWSDSTADDEEQVHGAAFATRGQKIAGTIRDSDAQAFAGHSRSYAADSGCVD